MGELIERFPLFPLGLVLLPREVVPLHIFEERYKLMIGQCIEDEDEFGVIWLSDEGLKDVGCSAAIPQVLERMDDGRMNILAQGSKPFALHRRIEDMPYPAGDVELLDEEDDPDLVDADVASDARERYADLVARVTDTRPEESDLEELDAYAMAATVDFPPESKQALLELRSEEEGLRMLCELFGSKMKGLDLIERATEGGRANGKVRF